MEQTTTKKLLRTFEYGALPAGTPITLTGEWDIIPYNAKARVIIDHLGRRCRVLDEDLEHALAEGPKP